MARLRNLAGAGRKSARWSKARRAAGRAGRKAGREVKEYVSDFLSNIDWAKAPGGEASSGMIKPGITGSNPANAVPTGVSPQTDQSGATKTKTSGTTLSAVVKSVEEVANSVTNIRSSADQAKTGILQPGHGNPIEALEPVQDATDKAEQKVEQLRKVTSTPLVESKQIQQIAEAAGSIQRSVATQQTAQAQKAAGPSLAAERTIPTAESQQATPATEAPNNAEDLQPAEIALKDFSHALEELTDQIKSKGAGGGEQGSSWGDIVNNIMGFVEEGQDVADAASVAKAVATPVGKFLAKAFPGAATKLSGSVAQRVAAVLSSNASKIVGKSIAGPGLVIGAYDAIAHAVQGDWVGAGLDAAAMAGSTVELTGVGAPAGAAVAMLASATSALRDSYNAIYGVNIEDDPNQKEHMNTITQYAVEWIKTQLGTKDKTEKTKEAQQKQIAVTMPSAATITPGGGSFGGAGSSGSWDAPTSTQTPSASAATKTSLPMLSSTTKIDVSTLNSSSGKEGSKKPKSSSKSSAPAPAAAAMQATPPVNTGATISVASTAMEQMVSDYDNISADVIDMQLGRPTFRPINPTGRQQTHIGSTNSPFFMMDPNTVRDFYFSNMEIGR